MPRNVIPAPLLCVLTSISMEHMAFLGDTLEKIASIRRGSLKQGLSVVDSEAAARSYEGDRGCL